MSQAVLRLPENTKGRDFVVGDIHGSFDLLSTALARVNFDPEVDRLFCVGDLVDRGEYSHLAAEFLKLPSVYCTRGNHEDMFLEVYEKEYPEAVIRAMTMRNGMSWWHDVPQELRAELIAAFRELPLVIEIQSSRGTVGFLHADVPAGMDWPTFLARIEAGDSKVIETALWGRSRVEHDDPSGVPGVGRLFVGHTPQHDGIKRCGNVYYIDTAAVFGAMGHAPGKLSLTNAILCTRVLLRPTPALALVTTMDGEPPARPFGAYCGSKGNMQLPPG